ncbi:NAD(P)H-quinone oxidoreductase [Ectothiorhodospiraceae bacterium WFHF3C12]|nr:NAD(P)H-quinone oxidoreductase [Ectothiorhodospiraceae bacterium WFHF3C12]
MKAWLIAEDSDQKSPKMQLAETETPTPGPGEVRVRVSSVGINRADLLQVQGLYPAPPGFDPRIPGLEYAGVVDAVGDKVLGHQVGDSVMGLVPGAAYAEYIVTTERELIGIPEGIDAADAAALPEDFLTAYRALFIEGGLQAGEWAMVRPVTSGVGMAAAQLIRAAGARVVGTSRSRERLDQAKALGLELDLDAIDGEDGVAEAVTGATGGINVAVEMVAGDRLNDTIATLRTEGRAIIVGLMGGRKGEINLGALLMGRRGIKAMTMRAQPLEERIRVAQVFNNRLAAMFTSGRLRPCISRRFAFDDAVSAHKAMAANEHLGKIILTL